MNRFITLTITTMAIITMATGCKKPAASNDHATNKPVSQTDTRPGTPQTFAPRFEALASSYRNWTDVKMPVSLNLKSPGRLSLSGQATMIRGRFLNISLRILGFEVAALTMTPDSIYAYEKRGKRYVAESITQLLKGFPATLSNLQDMLTGRPFLPGSNTLTGSDSGDFEFADVATDGHRGRWTMTTAGAEMMGASACWVVNGDKKPVVEALLVTLAGNDARGGSIIYSDLATTPAGPIAATVAAEATAGSKNVALEIEWNTGKAKWNTGLKPSWKLPGGYTRINGRDLVKMLGSL